MKKRVIYSILFGIPGLIAAGITTLLFSGMILGVLWLFVFGDNPWPSIIDTILPVLLILVFLASWAAFIVLGYLIGKQLEPNPTMNKSHIVISLSITLIAILFIVLYQFSLGNIGPQPDSVRCSDYCSENGYSASSLSPQNAGPQICSCLDNAGEVIMTVSIDKIEPGK